jgi:hypothetical protein
MMIAELRMPTRVGEAHGRELPCYDHQALPLLLFVFFALLIILSTSYVCAT